MVTSNSIETPPLERPRISSNQLAEFAFSTPSKKLRIIRDQKFGNVFSSPYYQPALDGLLHSFDGLRFDRHVLNDKRHELAHRPAAHNHQAKRWLNNAEMLKRFADISEAACPPAGRHTIIRTNAKLELEGVTVSVRPELVTQNPQAGLFSYTKLRFSKSKVSADASEIVLLLLMKYGQLQSHESLQLDPESTRLIDCHARAVIAGHKIERIREQQLQKALREIRHMWPIVRPAGEEPLQGAAR